MNCDKCSSEATCKGSEALNVVYRHRCDAHCDHLTICQPIQEEPAEPDAEE